MESDFDLVNYEKFVKQYMKFSEDSSLEMKSSLQIIPLASSASLVKFPTPIFRADNNFFLIFSEGGAKQQVDNDIIDLKANDVLFIREGHLTAAKSIDASSQGYFIHLDSTLLLGIFTKNSLLSDFTFNPKHTVSQLDMDWICKCLDLMNQLAEKDSKSLAIKTSMLTAIVLKLSNSSKVIQSIPNRQAEIAMLFKDLVYQNFKNKRDVSFYAKSLSVTKNYLNRCVKSITQKPPKQYINEVVIYHSQLLLQDFSKDISQVAFELDFQDPSYFGRLFKQITNQTPSEYRNLIMQSLSE